MSNISLHNCDCMDLMKQYPDKHFDLAIVDPPYGIGQNWKKDRHSKFYNHSSTYTNTAIPGEEFFKELFRVSVNQIIWGANYYTDYLPARQGWIVWDKVRDYKKQHMSEGELAWHSFNVPLRIYKNMWNGFCRSEKRRGDHPHEKPTALYRWLLNEYAQEGGKIIDTHLGSGSIAIACHDMGFDLTASEIDTEYYNGAVKRLSDHQKQIQLQLK